MEPSNKRVIINLRGILNDLKRRPEDAARELGISREEMESFLSGEKAVTLELVKRATEIWPVNERDFFLLRDDCPSGVKIMRASESEKSRRVMKRGTEEYYEYRDVAMSTVAPFRSEWIKELCVVANSDPNNPAIQWNNGHFLYGFHYFVGPVNFYYVDQNGKKQMEELNTGDSIHISSFVPHTFTTRKNPENELGYMLALTYGHKLGGETQQELSLLGPMLAKEFAPNFGERIKTNQRASGELVRFFRNLCSLSVDELATGLKLSSEEIRHIESGVLALTPEWLRDIAGALRVNTRDLLPPEQEEGTVLVRRSEDCRDWFYPSSDHRKYQMRELCHTKRLPTSKALEITVLQKQFEEFDLQTGAHQVIYNFGKKDAMIHWRSEQGVCQDRICPGDSLYIKPSVPHALVGDQAHLLALRTGGRIGGDAMLELGALDSEYIPRVLGETGLWFDPKGKN